MRIYAHRGLHGGSAPENSLRAFLSADEKGFPAELDVRLTKDGIPVVFHDNSLTRMTGVRGNIGDMNFSDIEKLRLLGTNERIPMLCEVLEKVSVPLLIEIKKGKTLSTRCEKTVTDALKDYGGEYMIQSFNRQTVKYCASRLKVPCGILVSDYSFPPPRADFINFRFSEPDIILKITKFRKRYESLLVWTPENLTYKQATEKFGGLGLNSAVCNIKE